MNLKLSDGFFDLCVNFSSDSMDNLQLTLSRLCQLGYRTVAINQVFSESIFDAEKKKRRKRKGEESETTGDLIPEPISVAKLIDEFSGRLRIFTRLTFLCAEPAKTHILAHCTNVKKYDLYAIAPKTQAALQFACSQLNADIITINEDSFGLKLTRKLYLQAVERGLNFEIQYGNFLNTNTRRQAIHLSHLFHMYGKSRNIIVSSGASDAMAVRDPYDVINLVSLAGLSECKSKASILWECESVLLKAGKVQFYTFQCANMIFCAYRITSVSILNCVRMLSQLMLSRETLLWEKYIYYG